MHKFCHIALNTCEKSAELIQTLVGGQLGMIFVKKLVSGLFFISLLAIQPVSSGLAAGTEGTIYDPQILTRMKFTPEQLPVVKDILNKSEARMIEVFEKYKIDPKAKPDFDLLRAASKELQAIEAWVQKQMKQVLNTSQYADYLEIQQATAAAVIKATRND